MNLYPIVPYLIMLRIQVRPSCTILIPPAPIVCSVKSAQAFLRADLVTRIHGALEGIEGEISSFPPQSPPILP
jgi:hypothetical protein